MRIGGLISTDLFGGSVLSPEQIVEVTLAGDGPEAAAEGGLAVRIAVAGPGVSTPRPTVTACPAPGETITAEVGIQISAPYTPGGTRPVTVIAEFPAPGRRAESPGAITIAETGWTMWMISHFHYDPVWWNTQGQYTQARIFLPDADGSLPDVRTAFDLVRLHLDAARRDPDYKFVLAEIDYLKPHFDAHPEDRADLLGFISAGRIEIVGGSYNEPNTNLTSAESTIRNATSGLAFQREMLGADPSTAWMLDAFGFDPGYPGLMAAAGLAESAWARGPFHQWGPRRTVGDNTRMQFAAEFEWLSPDGAGLLTSYMPNHYGAGWVTHRAASLPAAELAALEQFRQLAPVAATPNVLLPVGTDHVIPSRWATAIHRDWNARYVWPRFVTAVPSEFFAAVREDAAQRDTWITPQTRDMNPVYTGKDVSYIDTKQAQRAAEIATEDGERLATLAWLAGAQYPARSLDKAWRLLAFGAHHDAITGTEADQVYLDLLAGWREAYERGDAARTQAARYLAGLADTTGPLGAQPVVVFNTLSFPRSGLVTVTLDGGRPDTVELTDDTGAVLPCLFEAARPAAAPAGVTMTFRAEQVPALGYRTYWAIARDAAPARPAAAGWSAADGTVIENESFTVRADPARGGALTQVTDKRSGTHLLAGPGNELVLQEEYSQHPRWGEGPWLLNTTGAGTGSAQQPARVRAQRCAVGSRLIAEFALGGLQVTQETLLWDGADRIEFRTHVDGSIGPDQLLRVAFPAFVPGGLPIYQTATAVIGRSPGSADTDVEQHSFTLDNPAHEWFGLGSTARVAVAGAVRHAIGIAEVITPTKQNAIRGPVRELMLALARAGVTATCSVADGPRYGSIDLDSNLPDCRIVLGGPAQNPFTAQVLAAAGCDLDAWLDAGPAARLWVPAGQTRAAAFAPGADLRGPADLPVLIVAADDLAAAIRAVAADLADAVIEVSSAALPRPCPAGSPGQDSRTDQDNQVERQAGADQDNQVERQAGADQDGTADQDSGTDQDGELAGAGPGLAGHCVALLNRGMPGSLVTPGGVLLISLMRACSAWPCGVWIDGDKRTAPDGTSFAFQHWSHTFEYALAAGAGDWRSAGFVLAGQDYNRDLLAVLPGQHSGPLPARESLAQVTPPTAIISALKPSGNPLAPAGSPDPAGGITVRLRDISGGGGPARAQFMLRGGVRAASAADLCERRTGPLWPATDGIAEAQIPASGFVTLSLLPEAGLAVPGTGQPGAARAESGWPESGWPQSESVRSGSVRSESAPPESESAPSGVAQPESAPSGVAQPESALPGTAQPESARYGMALSEAQPVYTRYWLHGKGPAPAGNLPVAVHLSPATTALDPRPGAAAGPPDSERGALRLTVACGAQAAAGTVSLVGPAQLQLEPSGPLSFDLPARGYTCWDLAVRAAPGADPGRYFVAAQLQDQDGQVTEDAVLVTVGLPAPPALDLPFDDLLPLYLADQQATAAEVQVTLLTREVTVAPGGQGEIAVAVANATAAQIRGEAQLVSPFGSWAAVRQWDRGFRVEPGENLTLRFPVRVPPAARPGQRWWALVKVAYFGRLRYSEAAALIIGD